VTNGEMLISLTVAEASDSYGFVGVVKVGDTEAYRTLVAYPVPSEALQRTQDLMGSVLGELLAGAEWRNMRDQAGRPPTRQDYNVSAFRPPGGSS
jgi:hypothetical protein